MLVEGENKGEVWFEYTEVEGKKKWIPDKLKLRVSNDRVSKTLAMVEDLLENVPKGKIPVEVIGEKERETMERGTRKEERYAFLCQNCKGWTWRWFEGDPEEQRLPCPRCRKKTGKERQTFRKTPISKVREMGVWEKKG